VIAVGNDNSVYVADRAALTVSKVTPDGKVSVLAGQETKRGAVAGALPGTLGNVTGMAVGADNTVYLMMENAVFKIKQ
jgi:hypothetical protein